MDADRRLFIGGASADTATDQRIEEVSPASEPPIATVAAAGPADVMDAVSRVDGRAQANAEAAEQLRTATQQWTASAHRIAAHTEDLSRVARNLEQQLERFTVSEQ